MLQTVLVSALVDQHTEASPCFPTGSPPQHHPQVMWWSYTGAFVYRAALTLKQLLDQDDAEDCRLSGRDACLSISWLGGPSKRSLEISNALGIWNPCIRQPQIRSTAEYTALEIRYASSASRLPSCYIQVFTWQAGEGRGEESRLEPTCCSSSELAFCWLLSQCTAETSLPFGLVCARKGFDGLLPQLLLVRHVSSKPENDCTTRLKISGRFQDGL